MQLPSNTYYNKSGALINKNYRQIQAVERIERLEKEIVMLRESLNLCQAQLQSIVSSKNF